MLLSSETCAAKGDGGLSVLIYPFRFAKVGLGLQPTVLYRWQKEFFENGSAAFQQRSRPNHQAEQERIEYLEKKIQTKDEVLAELMAEHVALKKSLGEL